MPAHWRLSAARESWELEDEHKLALARHLPVVPSVSSLEAQALAQDLRAGIKGEVRFSDGDRALYATDGSNYRQLPIGVVIPRDSDDVCETLAACRRHGAPVFSRGGGTSLGGQTCNTAVVMDMSKYLNQVLEIDPARKSARVQPGTILDHLRARAEEHHLTFGPDPATHNRNTLGGMLGNDSCGMHAQMAGRTALNTHELDIVTYRGDRMKVGATSEPELERIIRERGPQGEVYRRLKALRDRYGDEIRRRFPDIPRLVSGYGLQWLLPENGFHVARALVGSESTCVTILEATLRLVYSPPERILLILGYPDIYHAGDHIAEIDQFHPIGFEGMDDLLFDFMARKNIYPESREYMPPGNGWLMVEFGGNTKAEAEAKARKLMRYLEKRPNAPSMKIFDKAQEEKAVWKVREAGLASTARVPGIQDTWPGWEDSAVPPDKVGIYLRKLRALMDEYGYQASLYGHFGQGCIHCSIDFDLKTEDGIGDYRAFVEEAADIVVSLGGSLSGEHGDGQARGELLPKMFGPEIMDAFREFKSIWDPDWKMNPGKKIDAYRLDQNLRLGTDYDPPVVKTHFKFQDDKGSMPYATLGCVGVGECRRTEGGTMCPSFMVTREEKHSTRGRAHLLHEMFVGNPLNKGWQSEPVKEALDLCLACKGCKSDCPMNVDMATYKAEFLSHYYEGRARPIAAYSMGLIDEWARIGSKVAPLANFITQTPGLRGIAKALAGIAPERSIPPFALHTFKDWFRARKVVNPDGPEVILWADTFNNYFHPATAAAAAEVLEAAGYRVLVPPQHLCCGRPLYDFGMLDRAESYLKNVVQALLPWIKRGVPLIGLEPSCLAVFRDEMRNLMPNDHDAMRLRDQSYLLSEFLEKKARHFELPRLERKAVVHGHCHHKAIMKMTDEEAVLGRLGLDFHVLDSGCCGMAGSFGFEKGGGHFDVSMKCGERVLLPAVREAAKDTLVISNGFSCRTQISQSTRREAMHLAEVIRIALFPDGGNPMSKEHSLFDPAESYDRALVEYRKEHGEPADSWVRSHPFKVFGLVLAVGAAGFLARHLRSNSWPTQHPTS